MEQQKKQKLGKPSEGMKINQDVCIKKKASEKETVSLNKLKEKNKKKRTKAVEMAPLHETSVIRRIKALMASSTGINLSDVGFEVNQRLPSSGKLAVALYGRKIQFFDEDSAFCSKLIAHEMAHRCCCR